MNKVYIQNSFIVMVNQSNKYDLMTPLDLFFNCFVDLAFFSAINTINNPDPNLELKNQTKIGFKKCTTGYIFKFYMGFHWTKNGF